MTKKCVPCIGAVIKEEISRRNKNLTELLQEIDDCEDPYDLSLCAVSVSKSEKKGSGKKAPSKYNVFIGECMKRKGAKGTGRAATVMKECAAEWKKNK